MVEPTQVRAVRIADYDMEYEILQIIICMLCIQRPGGLGVAFGQHAAAADDDMMMI
jgi:hypothetical protein